VIFYAFHTHRLLSWRPRRIGSTRDGYRRSAAPRRAGRPDRRLPLAVRSPGGTQV